MEKTENNTCRCEEYYCQECNIRRGLGMYSKQLLPHEISEQEMKAMMLSTTTKLKENK